MATSLRLDLVRLRKLKRKAEDIGRKQKAAGAEFKQHQARVVERMQSEDTDSIGTNGTLFSLVTKVNGQVEDRRQYVRWALEQDEGVQRFLIDTLIALDTSQDDSARWVEGFYETVMNTELVTYKEKTDLLNSQANQHIDDGVPLPPGLTFRPDHYVSQRAR